MAGGGGSSPYDEYGYIKDGKIFHLDGIDKGDTANAWTDLIGGIVFYKGSQVEELVNGWKFLATNANSCMPNNDSSTIAANENITVEVCIDSSTNNFCIFATPGVTINMPLFYSNNKVVTFLQRRNTYTLTSATGAHCYSLNLDQGCEDGVQKTKNSGTDYWNNTGNFILGARNNGSGQRFAGTIYAIRIYSRRLSFAEQLYNQQIDNTRFNLGLTI